MSFGNLRAERRLRGRTMFELAGMGLVAAMMGDRAWGEMGVCVQDEGSVHSKGGEHSGSA